MAHKRLAIFLIGFFAVITIASVLVNTISSGRKISWLGIIGGTEQDSCTGELKITSKQVDERCELQADLIMQNCQGKKWYVVEGNSCSENNICTGNINDQITKWKCSWESNKGTYVFSLCADLDVKARNTISC